MINWYKGLYVGSQIGRKRKRIMKMLEKGKIFPELFVITLAACESDQLDIMNAKYLSLKSVREQLPPIIALAIGREEAEMLVVHIIEKCYNETGDCHVRGYLGY